MNRDAPDTRLEMDSDIPPDPSRTFGPSPERRVDLVCSVTWVVVIVVSLLVACLLVHAVARWLS